jgi:hypothetical protein
LRGVKTVGRLDAMTVDWPRDVMPAGRLDVRPTDRRLDLLRDHLLVHPVREH